MCYAKDIVRMYHIFRDPELVHQFTQKCLEGVKDYAENLAKMLEAGGNTADIEFRSEYFQGLHELTSAIDLINDNSAGSFFLLTAIYSNCSGKLYDIVDQFMDDLSDKEKAALAVDMPNDNMTPDDIAELYINTVGSLSTTPCWNELDVSHRVCVAIRAVGIGNPVFVIADLTMSTEKAMMEIISKLAAIHTDAAAFPTHGNEATALMPIISAVNDIEAYAQAILKNTKATKT